MDALFIPKNPSSDILPLNTKIVQLIENNGWFLICPEQLGRLNSKRTYEDVTENLIIGAQEMLKIVKMYHIKEAVMKVGKPIL